MLQIVALAAAVLCVATAAWPLRVAPAVVRMSAGSPMDGGPPRISVGESQPGGPPPGVGGRPSGGGGPPARTPAQQLVDTLFETAFPLLYAFEPDGMLDSEKNLRVLWVRALLASLGKIKDDVAFELLPGASRWLVGKSAAPFWPAAVTDKLDWIVKRTEFIDAALDEFLSKNAGEGLQVVLLGAGYDTRSLRYRDADALFFEVDLPSVLPVKESMAQRYLSNAPVGGVSVGSAGRSLGVDLNRVTMAPPGVFAQLRSLGLDTTRPTLVVCEALLFYLSPPAKAALLSEISAVLAEQPASQLVLTDNLAPFVRGPVQAAADSYLNPLGIELLEHDTLWGGAIQFVRAETGLVPEGEAASEA